METRIIVGQFQKLCKLENIKTTYNSKSYNILRKKANQIIFTKVWTITDIALRWSAGIFTPYFYRHITPLA